MKPIPWRYINSWSCIACGVCCRGYDVVLKYPEWVKIIQTYGIGVTTPGINRFYSTPKMPSYPTHLRFKARKII